MSEDLSGVIEEVIGASGDEQSRVVSRIVATQEPADVALLLESLPLGERIEVWGDVPALHRLPILVAMRADPREHLLDSMELSELDALFDGMAAEDLLELADSLPNRMVERAILAMDEQQRRYFEHANQYADDEAGHWVNHHLLVLPLNARVRDGLRLVRREIPKYADAIFLINRAGAFSEAVKLDRIFGEPDHRLLTELSEDDFATVAGQEDAVDASFKVQTSGLGALPVVDEAGKLLGRLDMGTANELVNEYYEGQIMATAGLDENEDLFSPVIKTTQGRSLWLAINLLTAFLASWFIGLFEATLQQVVALAVLMPVVASMGGIAGSQTLTLMIRGLALGQVTATNLMALLFKEMKVGALNGVIWAAIIGLSTAWWFDQVEIGAIIAIAILLNIVAAALSAVTIPMVLSHYKLDPALSASVVLTTVTDIVGFVAFLGLGTIILT